MQYLLATHYLASPALRKKTPLNPLPVNHPRAVESQVSDTF